MAEMVMLHSSRRHVFRDLRPYICTFQDCKRPEHLFESMHEWFDHEKMLHRREWFCNSCSKLFPNSSEFQRHLIQAHTGQFESEEQMQIAINRSERAIESKQRCNLCEQDNLSPHLLQQHLGRHIQQLSLFVVPGSEFVEESDSNSSKSVGHDNASLGHSDDEGEEEEKEEEGGEEEEEEEEEREEKKKKDEEERKKKGEEEEEKRKEKEEERKEEEANFPKFDSQCGRVKCYRIAPTWLASRLRDLMLGYLSTIYLCSEVI